MAFEGLSQKLSSALSKLTGRGKLTEQAVREGMREVRMALLEADVNYLVVKDFCKRVTERCVGQQVLDSLSPAQQVIKIVNEEMTALMGTENARLTWSSSVPTIYMLCGLQGAGKTTMAAKLANYLQKTGKKPLLAACDIYRPAAIKQLLAGFNKGIFTYSAADNTAKVTFKYKLTETELTLYIDKGMISETWSAGKAIMNGILALVGEDNPEIAAILTAVIPQVDTMLEGFNKIEVGAKMTRK